jgi:hypothetical protein
MIRLLLAGALLSALAGCRDSNAGDRNEAPPTSAEAVPVAIDASIAPPPADAAPPLTGAHLDSLDTTYRPRTTPRPSSKAATVQLVLRSSPPGAAASIDGKLVGMTPTFWQGPLDHRPHEYTFVKEGYAVARYRFVATRSGVVHGTLHRLVEGGLDAGALE